MTPAADSLAGLFARLVAALGDMPETLTRDRERTEGARYRYLTEASILPPIRHALAEHGLAMLLSEASPPVREATAQRVRKGTGELIPPEHAVTVHLRALVLCGETGEQLAVDVYGAAIDREGRGHASARTDAVKGLRQAFAIAADDEPQNTPADEPLTRADVQRIARELGYTDDERDHVIAVWSHTPAEQLAAVPDEQLDAVAAMLASSDTLGYRDRTREAGPAPS